MKENERKKTDEELVALAQGGDKQARDKLMFRYADFVRGRARGYFLVGGDTDDLIQEGMIGLFRAIEDYKYVEGGKSFKNFAYMCVRRQIIDAVKKSLSKKNQPLNTSLPLSISDLWAFMEPSPEDEMILRDEMKEYRQKMSRGLSDFEFKIFIMYMDGMTCAEICATTGKPFKSVDNAIQRSKRKLQQLLKK
ncbi:MAG: sigma-70 family RNA polymerase sigma factor [Clostridia bacterium]|nr:sigma-70 family RNA polymerase sigma factor [Clostridia bacterium]